MDDVALLEAGAVGALDLVHHVARDLRVERPLQHHLRLGVARVDREVVEPPVLWSRRLGQCHSPFFGNVVTEQASFLCH